MFTSVEIKITYGIEAIVAYVEHSSNRTPILNDYIQADILDVNKENIARINSVIRQKNVSEVDTKEKIQTIVNHINSKISIDKA